MTAIGTASGRMLNAFELSHLLSCLLYEQFAIRPISEYTWHVE